MQLKQGYKVLQIVNRMNLGGITMQICIVTSALSKKNTVRVLAGLKDESEASSNFMAESMGITVESIDSMHKEINPKSDFKAYQEIRKIIKEFKPDIVHTHAAKAGLLGRLAASKEKVPVILHTFHGHVFHSYFGKVKTKVFIELERMLARKSTKIIAISNKQKQELSEQFKIAEKDKFEVIPLGFDLEKFSINKVENRKTFREKYSINDDEIAIGIIGRLVPIKNHSLFLEAFAIAKSKTTKKIKAVIIGDGELKEMIEDLAKSLNLTFDTKNGVNVDIVFTSWILEIDKAIHGLDIIALTSLNEGTPVSLIEAQAAGIPILSTDVGGIRDIVEENKTCLLSSNNDIKAFSKNLIELIENETTRSLFIENGPKLANKKFSQERLITDTENLYEKLILEHLKQSI